MTEATETGNPWHQALSKARVWLSKHHKTLWWLHSAWALIFGIGFMWLGAKNFAYLRVAIFHIAFIWVSSLFLPVLLRHPRISAVWASRLRLLVNYFNKNFFQQVVFFVLPVYHQSATYPSRNMLFMGILAVSAVLSTLDTVYDDHISAKWHYMALFLAFNMFACFNVMLPVLWKIGNTLAIFVSGFLATAAFCSLCLQHARMTGRRRTITAGLAALLLAVLSILGRPLVPPVPLKLASGVFGSALSKRDISITNPLTGIPSDFSANLYAVTAVRAPMGLTEKIRHVWYRNGEKIAETRLVKLQGGRKEGYRYWSYVPLQESSPGTEFSVAVQTEGGQLIGQIKIKGAP